MPSSAKDRFTVDFEYVYFFVKNKKYWFEQQFDKSSTEFIYSRKSNKGGVQAKNNPHSNWGYTREELKKINRQKSGWETQRGKGINTDKYKPGTWGKKWNMVLTNSPLGKNKRCVWTIPTRPNPEAHFAAFNSELITPMILSGCPEFICKECGKAREKIIDGSNRINTRPGKDVGNAKSGTESDPNKNLHNSDLSKYRQKIISKVVGYTDCECENKYESGIVLDPFAGIGTTLYTAWKLGRNYIGFEISSEYCKIAEKYLSKTKYKRLDKF